jgi:hypothetical protein
MDAAHAHAVALMASTPKSLPPADPLADDAALGPSPTLRSVLSLVIFIHFCCVFVVLSSTFRRSALQSRLVAIFGPYTQVIVQAIPLAAAEAATCE